jgi:uncharacterized membrane protein YqjE
MSTVKNGRSDIAGRLRETAEDLVELVAAQVKLVRLELLADAESLGSRLMRLAIFGALVFLGYACLVGAASLALAPFLGLGGALAAVGAVHLLAGGAGIWLTIKAVRSVRVLDRSRDELDRSLKELTAVAPPPPPAV